MRSGNHVVCPAACRTPVAGVRAHSPGRSASSPCARPFVHRTLPGDVLTDLPSRSRGAPIGGGCRVTCLCPGDVRRDRTVFAALAPLLAVLLPLELRAVAPEALGPDA